MDWTLTPELKARWLSALRGDTYTQATDSLRERGPDDESLGHCCLGVLADLIDPNGWNEFDDWHACSADLEDSVEGLDYRTQSDLMTMNDGDEPKGIRSCTFEEIADWIEANITPVEEAS
jgi:hypothetical protein